MTSALGNVRVVISDLKEVVTAGTEWGADIRSWNNYYPFGMLQPGRHGSAADYRYGFNGKEMDNEVREDAVTGESGVGNHYDYGFRLYDARLAKFVSVDPLADDYPSLSTFHFAANNPIRYIDLDGLEPADPGSFLGEGQRAPVEGSDDDGDENWVYLGLEVPGVTENGWLQTNNVIVTQSELLNLFPNAAQEKHTDSLLLYKHPRR